MANSGGNSLASKPILQPGAPTVHFCTIDSKTHDSRGGIFSLYIHNRVPSNFFSFSVKEKVKEE
jgi:hypothetical protein